MNCQELAGSQIAAGRAEDGEVVERRGRPSADAVRRRARWAAGAACRRRFAVTERDRREDVQLRGGDRLAAGTTCSVHCRSAVAGA